MPGRRRILPSHPLLRRLVLLGLAVALFLTGLEATLRLLPRGWINPLLGNHVYSVYGTFPGGIYFKEPETGASFMIPDLETTAYWNGYTWRHRTDGRGFRNPPGAEPGLLLYGDSLIYGHGVVQTDTVAHRLREDWGHPAYNMAQQGHCLYQQYLLARLYLDRLRPRRAVLFVFTNDFADLLAYRSAEELAAVPEVDGYDYAAIRQRIEVLGRNPGRNDPWWWSAHRSRALRLLRGLALELPKLELVATAEAAGGHAPYLDAVLDPVLWQRTAGYYRRVLPEVVREHRRRGVGLAVVLLPLGVGDGPAEREAIQRIDDLLVTLSRDLDVPYAVAGERVFADCRQCFLPRDGHLSPEGHRRLAAFLHRRVLSRSSRVGSWRKATRAAGVPGTAAMKRSGP